MFKQIQPAAPEKKAVKNKARAPTVSSGGGSNLASMFTDVCGSLKKGMHSLTYSGSSPSAVVATSTYDRAVESFDEKFPDLTPAQKLKFKKAMRDNKDKEMFLKLNGEEVSLFVSEILET